MGEKGSELHIQQIREWRQTAVDHVGEPLLMFSVPPLARFLPHLDTLSSQIRLGVIRDDVGEVNSVLDEGSLVATRSPTISIVNGIVFSGDPAIVMYRCHAEKALASADVVHSGGVGELDVAIGETAVKQWVSDHGEGLGLSDELFDRAISSLN